VEIVILQAGNTIADIAARRGDFDAWIRHGIGDAWAGDFRTHDLRDGAPLPDPRGAAAFVITGSSSSVTERAPWMLRAEAFVRELVAHRVPLFGICFGHQLVAQALGGNVSKNPRGREIGTVRATRSGDDALFDALPRELVVHATHVDAVERLPSGARVLAQTSLDPAAAFAVGDSTRCVQFHPEFDADVMRGYVRGRAHLIRGEGGDPDRVFAGIEEETHGRHILGAFVRRFLRP